WGAAAAAAAAALCIAFWFARRITRPLHDLTAGARRIAAGDFGHTVPVEGRDEVGALAQVFNAMSRHLATQFAALEEDRQQLRAVLSGMIEGVVALDAQQRILFANERAAQLLEFQTETAVGRRLWEVVRQRPIQELVENALVESSCREQELNWSGAVAKSLT